MRPALAALTCAFLVAIAIAAPAWADNWADSDDPSPEYAASKAICRKAEAVKLPQPDPAVKVAKDCDSSALYYGIGRPADPAAARACALTHVDASGASDSPTDGAAMLATIYANGQGAPRDLDLAIAYACRIDGAPAEMDGRIKHLEALKTNGPSVKPFDLCDDITSGAMEGFCAEREGDLANIRRDGELAAIADGLHGAARAAYDRLKAAETAFAKSSEDNEVDVSGTARGALIIAAEQGHAEAFVTTLRAVFADRLRADDRGAADRRLNAVYDKVMSRKDMAGLGTVGKPGIKATQRNWLAYRDAFVAFTKAAAPHVSPDALAAHLTRQRTKELAELASE